MRSCRKVSEISLPTQLDLKCLRLVQEMRVAPGIGIARRLPMSWPRGRRVQRVLAEDLVKRGLLRRTIEDNEVPQSPSRQDLEQFCYRITDAGADLLAHWERLKPQLLELSKLSRGHRRPVQITV